jgi:hypothetical protein
VNGQDPAGTDQGPLERLGPEPDLLEHRPRQGAAAAQHGEDEMLRGDVFILEALRLSPPGYEGGERSGSREHMSGR